MIARVLAAWAVTAVMTVAAAPVASAQDSRADEIAQAQAEKAQRPVVATPNRAEEIALKVRNILIGDPNGFYPWFDSAYSGGGFTLGAGYREFTGDKTFWDARGLYSAKGYKRFEILTTSLALADGRINLQGIGGWRDATQVAFYGVGGETVADAQTNFGMQWGYAGGSAHLTLPARLFADAGAQYEGYAIKSGSGSSPSTETVFTPGTAPGLSDDPAFIHLTAGGGVDTRAHAGYARRGGLYALSYDMWGDRDSTYDFDSLQAEVVQHLPILRENWVVSLHGVVQTTLDDAATVPFFLMPSLGGGSTLRAYSSWRFRDRHSMLLQAEYRWIPSRLALDMALFYDAGMVAPRREDLSFSGLKTDVGIGVRFHAPAATPLRVELAHGSEGLKVVFAGGAAF